jgi:phosphoribosylamine--glycine ligase
MRASLDAMKGSSQKATGASLQRVLVIGQGGREYSLALKLLESPSVQEVGLAPGSFAQVEALSSFAKGQECGKQVSSFYYPNNVKDLRSWAEKVAQCGWDLVVVGPDQALADGVVDCLEAVGVVAFGPRQAAAKMEWSKAFAKEVMQAAGVPTARFKVFDQSSDAIEFLNLNPGEWVVKADGLALGKGVKVCTSTEEAKAAVGEFMQAECLSGADQSSVRKVLIEERLTGEEWSWLAFCDGERVSLLDPARDYKRLAAGDLGPNTGGMGAFSPVPGVPERYYTRIRDQVFLPVLRELKRRGITYRGILYAGLMVDLSRDSIWVIEFNSRFGDPEAQVLLPRIDGDLAVWCQKAAMGDLSDRTLTPERVPMSKSAAVVVVAAAPGYPDQPKKNIILRELKEKALQKPFHFSIAGVGKTGSETPVGDREWVSTGGRVFGAIGQDPNVELARQKALAGLQGAAFKDMQFRSDIALLERPKFAVFASGRGSNFVALVEAVRSGKLSGEITQVVTDQEGAGVIAHAEKYGIRLDLLHRVDKAGKRLSKEEVELQALRVVAETGARFVVLAGYMRLLSLNFLKHFKSRTLDGTPYFRVINIHPSLLPEFPGRESYRSAFQAGAPKTGVTIHLVDEGMDTGPILAQEEFGISDCRSDQEVEQRGLSVEHRLYPEVLHWVLKEKFDLKKGSFRVSTN